jgi:tetratricopeptide (TPR) repeat protein
MGKPGLVICLLLLTIIPGMAQKSVVDLFKSYQKLAQEYFKKGDIQNTIQLLQQSNSPSSLLMLGQSYFLLKEYNRSIDAYDQYMAAGRQLEKEDLLNYAEAQLTLKNYKKAQAAYQELLAKQSEDWITKKLWRISNMEYLFEDSAHFAIRSLSVNTTDAEWGGVFTDRGLLFISNRSLNHTINKIDAATQHSFYDIYLAPERPDTLFDGWSTLFVKPKPYTLPSHTKGNIGSFALYEDNTKIVYTASSAHKNSFGLTSLGLYFAELQHGKWHLTNEFIHNNLETTVTDPSISADGKTLYFSSDRKGGYGGMDLYRSQRVNDSWTEPVNLGEGINTPLDEVFPYVSSSELYFASNGHAGMGGLDLFKVSIDSQADSDPVNLGYPLNSSYDDFTLTLTDEKGTRGFLSSNRKRGGLDDDIYEFEMDLQTYPYTIMGTIKQKDHDWSDSTSLKILNNAQILLIDNVRNVIVAKITSDDAGQFQLSIPYFSKYSLHVVDSDGVENIVILELPRQRRESMVHEIVVIKDIFQTIK